ncbi:ShlB/FhaC/HecB family hemolysin secretion/activation protein [uncultured Zoogloea sp.]|uniref:ShlB/FhaC/HecB family hemolysin secretion/activation protein n=1 Tax=uncultured Zoogloea sp. TaxID=160237 RepID=UPI002619AA99|nr:ShlB/FhaC/HecB family hemolysin secretion/activation protein [uncultured Zoogloea sp.]
MTLSPSHPQHLAPTSLGNAHSRQTCDITANGSRDHQAIDGRPQLDCHYGESRNGQTRLPQLLHRDSGTKTCAILKTRGRQSGDTIDDPEVVIRRHSMPGGTAGHGPRASTIRAPLAALAAPTCTTFGIRSNACLLNHNVFAGPPSSRSPDFQTPIALMGFAIGLTCQPLAISPESGF